MIQDTELFNTRRAKSENTDDGDLLITWEVKAKGFAGIKAYNAETVNYHGMYPIGEWIGCGNGWLKAQFQRLIDGTEIAIEAANDAWAKDQEAREAYEAHYRY